MLQYAEEAIAIVLLVQLAMRIIGAESFKDRPGPIPPGSLVLLALVAIPTIAQSLWHPVFTALALNPHQVTAHHQYWRLITSVLVQDNGAAGAVFNLASLAIIGTLAGWFWGGRRTIAMFFALGVALDLAAVLTDTAGAGNSGATFALAATLAGYVLIRGPLALRLRSAAVLAFSGLIWTLGNFHGMAILAGGVLGAILATASLAPALDDWQARAERGSSTDTRSNDSPVPTRPAQGHRQRSRARDRVAVSRLR